MSPEAQIIAIEEVRHPGAFKVFHKTDHGMIFGELACGVKEPIPNYPKDLNAMHEAEKVLTPDQLGQYVSLYLECAWMSDCSHHVRAATATATQRAKAFLKTIGKWEDEQ